MTDHPIWLLLVASALIWYSTITIFVAIKGVADIRGMFNRLSQDDM